MWERVWQIGRHYLALLHVLRCSILTHSECMLHQVDRYGNNRQIFEHPVADTELLNLLNQRLAYYLDYRIKDLQAAQCSAAQPLGGLRCGKLW